jgi:hypothetical protein
VVSQKKKSNDASLNGMMNRSCEIVMPYLSQCMAVKLSEFAVLVRPLLSGLIPEFTQKPIAIRALALALHLDHKDPCSCTAHATRLGDSSYVAVVADEIFPYTDCDARPCYSLKARFG